MTSNAIIVRQLGRAAYEQVYVAMRDFTDARTPDTPDELWLVEHEPVFTLGQAADPAHVLNAGSIAVVKTDRGGEVTYHGPGQAVAYLLMDLRRRQSRILVREFVRAIESAVIDTLAAHGLSTERHEGAPGIYLAQDDAYGQWQGAKIAALGLKVLANGCTYHGVALNVAMDLSPFTWINPCGYAGLQAVDMKTMGVEMSFQDAQSMLADALLKQLQGGRG